MAVKSQIEERIDDHFKEHDSEARAYIARLPWAKACEMLRTNQLPERETIYVVFAGNGQPTGHWGTTLVAAKLAIDDEDWNRELVSVH